MSQDTIAELCNRIDCERNPQKIIALIQELRELLAKRQAELESKIAGASTASANAASSSETNT